MDFDFAVNILRSELYADDRVVTALVEMTLGSDERERIFAQEELNSALGEHVGPPGTWQAFYVQ